MADFLEQAFLHFFLTGDAVLGPRHRFEPLLLHFFLAVGANAVLILLDPLESRVNQIQQGPVGIGHPKEKLLGVGIRRFVRQIHRGIFVRRSSLFLCARDGSHDLFAPRQQFLFVIVEPFLIHRSPAPLLTFWGHLKTP